MIKEFKGLTKWTLEPMPNENVLYETRAADKSISGAVTFQTIILVAAA